MIDLVDSTLVLEIRGVPVRRVRLQGVERSAVLAEWTQAPAFRERLAAGLTIVEERGNLPKQPIRVEIAPRDTLEAKQAGPRVLKPEAEDIRYMLRLDAGLWLDLRQAEAISEEGAPDYRRFCRNLLKEGLREDLAALLHGRIPRHDPAIVLTLPQADIKALYRALGEESGLALRL